MTKPKSDESWFMAHPWMTFFLAGTLISTVGYIIRGPEKPFFGDPMMSGMPRLPPTTRGQYF